MRSANRTRVKVVKKQVQPTVQTGPSLTSCMARASAGKARSSTWASSRASSASPASWFTYEGRAAGPGQGERPAPFLMENLDVANEIEKKIKEKLGIGAVVTADDLTANDEVLPAPRRLLRSLERSRARGPVPASAHREGRESAPSWPVSWPSGDTPTTSATGVLDRLCACRPGRRRGLRRTMGSSRVESTPEKASAPWLLSCEPRAWTTT